MEGPEKAEKENENQGMEHLWNEMETWEKGGSRESIGVTLAETSVQADVATYYNQQNIQQR